MKNSKKSYSKLRLHTNKNTVKITSMYTVKHLKPMVRKFFKYVIVGVIATGIYLGLLYALTDIAGIYYLTSAILSFCVSTAVGFFGHKYFTFQSKETKHGKQMAKFFIIAVNGLAFNTLGVYISVELMGLWYVLGAAITSGFVFIINFALNNAITFRQSTTSETRHMQMLILCGGLGTRLRPLTTAVTKCMLEFEGRPFLEYIINYYKNQGIKEFVLSVGHLKESIIDHFQDGSKWSVNIKYCKEDSPLGTGGAIKKAEPMLNNEFFVANGDTFTQLNLKKIENFHKAHHSLCTICVKKSARGQNSGHVTFDNNHKIINFKSEEIKKEGFVSTGIYLINKTFLDRFPDGRSSIEDDIFPHAKGLVTACPIENGYFIDIGTFETYNHFTEEIKKIKFHL